MLLRRFRPGFGRSTWMVVAGLVMGAGGILVVALCSTPRVVPVGSLHQGPDRFVIIYTGETDGYLQSCGCAARQVGGLARRATLVKRLARAYPASVLIDTGNHARDIQRSQAVMEYLRLLNYDAVGVGELDLKLGRDFMRAATSHDLPLTLYREDDKAHEVPSARIINEGRAGVAILKLRPDETRPNWERLRRYLQGLRDRTGLVVVVSDLRSSSEEQFVASLGGRLSLDVLVGQKDAQSRRSTVSSGVLSVAVPEKGEVGVLEVRWRSEGKAEVQSRLERVSDDLPLDEGTQAVVSRYYQEQAKVLLEASSAQFNRGGQVLPYVSATECSSCHVKQVQQWGLSKHAAALQVLQEKRRLVPECLQCHSEYYRQTRQFHPAVAEAALGIECATCHGDGQLHAALGGKGSVARKVPQQVCAGCHNRENDPTFDYPRALERIRHW